MFDRNIRTVALREFWVTVRRKGYLILTFGMPVFIVLYIGLIMIPQYFIARKEAARRFVGVVDESGLLEGVALENAGGDLPPDFEKLAKVMGGKNLEQAKKEAGLVITRYGTAEEAARALEAQKIYSYFVVAADYVQTGKVQAFSRDSSIFSSAGMRTGFLRKALLTRLLERAEVSAEYAERIQNPMELEEFTVSKETGRKERNKLEEAIRLAVPFGFSILLFLSIMTGAGFLLHGISEEKENRIMEVVLSSVSARTFFWGKLLGLGSAGFLQIFVWLVLGGLPLSLAVAVLEIPLWLVGLAFVYYLLGFFLYGALILGTGSLGTNLKEAQQMSMVWSMTGGIGLAFIMPIADDPQSALAVVMSYVPLLTPTVMVARAALGGAMWYEHVLAVALLLATLYFANKFSSKVFRLGLLSYGKKPKIREIWRWMRQGV